MINNISELDQLEKQDHNLLNDILMDVIFQFCGAAFFETLQKMIKKAHDYRDGNDQALGDIENIIENLDESELETLSRATANMLNISNLVEQHHSLRKSRFIEQQREQIAEQNYFEPTNRQVFQTLLAAGVSKESIFKTVKELNVELVLTAHPTEIVRKTMSQKYSKLMRVLKNLEMQNLTHFERNEELQTLRREIAAIWASEEIRRSKITVIDETRAGLLVIEEILFYQSTRYLKELDLNVKKFLGFDLPIDFAPIKFGSWMGGDRDGNPFVTASVTYDTTLMTQKITLDLLLQQLNKLRAELSMTTASQELIAKAETDFEPYRAYLLKVKQKLQQNLLCIERKISKAEPLSNQGYQSAEELINDLRVCYDSLVEKNEKIIADGLLLDFIRRVAIFGFSMTKLDIRQDSQKHALAMSAITECLGLGSYDKWSEDEKIDFLLRELDSKRPLIPYPFDSQGEVKDVLDTFETIARIDPHCLGVYIISMSRNASDILLVELFQKSYNVKESMRVVPLFETLKDLLSAKNTIEQLLQSDWYRKKINGNLQVMIGYSDSSKDGGKLSASWDLYKCQEDIVNICAREKIQLTLFHGRGGTIGRGGGPTFLGILSQPPGSVQKRLKVTIQGEMIKAKFGLAGVAIRELDAHLASTLQATLLPPAKAKEPWRKIMDEMAEYSCSQYRSIVKNNHEFISYFRLATPETELGNLNIGSRPARRNNQAGGIETLRAIPWIFAWTQTRLLLPSWLGVGEALKFAIENGHEKILFEMFEQWPFFQSTISLIEMVIAKADIKIAAMYDNKLVPDELKPLGKMLREKFQLTKDMILHITQQKSILEKNPELRYALGRREPYLDILNLIQIEIMARLRQDEANGGGATAQEKRRVLLSSINGIAMGMRNTG